MARPLPRRRSEREAPDADRYTQTARDDDAAGDEDRRPRRGRARGELPTRGRDKDEERLPASVADLDELSEKEYEALCDRFKIPQMDDPNEEGDALLAAISDYLDEQQPDDEPPSRGRRGRSRDADDEDDAPRRGRGRSSRDEEPDDEPAPRRGRGRSRDEDDEPPSRGRGRGRSSRDDDEDDEPRGRGRGRGRGRDDEDDEPRGSVRGRGRGRGRDDDDEDEDRPKRKPRGGFAGYKTTRSKTFTEDFKLTPDLLLAKFLDDEPFDTYAEHGLYQELKDGQRVWICIEEDCPICATGHKPRAIALWNIVAIPEEGDPRHEVLKAGPALSKEIEKKASLKTGPMSKEYYALAQPEQEKNSGPIPPIVEVVRERDVEDEWNFKPFTDGELEDFREDCPDPNTYLQFPKRSALREVARKLRDSD